MATKNFSKTLAKALKKNKAGNPFVNRELSWLRFNSRVLFQSTRKEVPLIERFKFLGISASNLDEFIMVRLSTIINKIQAGSTGRDIAGMTPFEEYSRVFKEVIAFKEAQDICYDKLRDKLKSNDVVISKYKDLTKDEKDVASKLFANQIYPALTPIALDTSTDIPLIQSKQLCIVVATDSKIKSGAKVVSIIPIGTLDRMYCVGSKGDCGKYILLEDIIFNNLHKIFINKEVAYHGCMRILREADIELERDTDVYIVDRMKQTLLRRQFSRPIFMDVDKGMPKEILKTLVRMFRIDKRRVYKSSAPVDLSFLASKPIRRSEWEYESFTPVYPRKLIGEDDMISAIDDGDILLHHPYESFLPVVKFLESAAIDPGVIAIKQTLYRVSSSDSPIVAALCRAAENGKQVSIMLEIKARFDEERNISLIDKLKASGCKLIYGIEGLKTHCKFILVIKRGNKSLKTYCHLGTGNYNDKTAKLYTDVSYFTANRKTGDDLLAVFNMLSGDSEPAGKVNSLYYAPYNLRSTLYSLIDKEIDNAKKGKKASIAIKLNSISDKGIIERLYVASKAGVKLDIFCRGICSMKPINKNISIRSVVGRYLEHGRIYRFLNGGKPKLFITSADLLSRNLDRRVEILVPITDSSVMDKLHSILKAYHHDTFNTSTMDADGLYEPDKGSLDINIHDNFMKEVTEESRIRTVKNKN